MTHKNNRHPSSFRDPSGAVIVKDGAIYRTIGPLYLEQYKRLQESGFYKKLFDKNLLIPHEEVQVDGQMMLKPDKVSFFSYPYEWSFTQYKHAALHTLKLQKYCLQHGFTLKDATAFNVTFHKGAPVFIDTLSFDDYIDGRPWRAYKQFVMHFLAPLVLARYYGNDMLKLLSQHIDGVPLQLAASLLPFKAKLNPVLYTNIFLTAKYDAKYSGDKGKSKEIKVSKAAQVKILDSLYAYIKGLEFNEKSEWKEYYTFTNYDAAAFEYKKKLVTAWYDGIKVPKVIDVGGNDGTFSRLLKDRAGEIVVTDIDANAVARNYEQVLQGKEHNILPIVSDLLNPSPGIGLNNTERIPLLDRITEAGFGLTLALALIHHISLSGNVPFDMSAKLFASVSPYLIIEFPDREDSWVQFLLNSKREFAGHFDNYTKQNFEREYSEYFEIIKKEMIPDTHRTMYVMKTKSRHA